MRHKIGFIGLALAAVAVIGAGCKSTTTLSSNNKNLINATTEINTNGTTVNTNTTGSFDTNVNTSVTTNTNASISNATTITITSAGVDNPSLTVSKGTTVTFINNDSVTHEIASDPHPVHTDTPGFQGQISPGGRYSFTFTQAKTAGYHDHLDPFNSKFQGKVIVQ